MIRQQNEHQTARTLVKNQNKPRPYSTPRLLSLGDIRAITLAPTPIDESESTNGDGYREDF